MTINGRTIYGCECCSWETRRPERKRARRAIRRRERAAWKREVKRS